MNESILHLAVAMGAFVASHIVMSISPVRAPLVNAIGEWGFKAVYSIISVALLAWVIMAYGVAPKNELFEPGTAMRHASLTMMLLAAFFLVCGYTTPNPGIMGMEAAGLKSGAKGVLKITRHPVMWGVALWGTSHVLGNGHAAALTLFGGMVALALVGAAHIDVKRRETYEQAWSDYEAETSFWPLAALLAGRTKVEKGEVRWWQSLLTVALYMGMLWAHAAADRDVFPLGFF